MNLFRQHSPQPSMQSGVTLVEMVITIVLVSIALVGVISAFSGSMSRSADPLWRNKSLKLAQLYLDEILAKPYDEQTLVGGGYPIGFTYTTGAFGCSDAALGTDGEGSRADYDDVDDFDDISDTPPQNVLGTLDASAYAGYQVSVQVSCDGTTVGASGTNANAQAKRITVTVTPPNGQSMAFTAYRGNF